MFIVEFEPPTIRSQGERSTICTIGAHDQRGIHFFSKKSFFLFLHDISKKL